MGGLFLRIVLSFLTLSSFVFATSTTSVNRGESVKIDYRTSDFSTYHNLYYNTTNDTKIKNYNNNIKRETTFDSILYDKNRFYVNFKLYQYRYLSKKPYLTGAYL